MKKGSNKKDR